MWPEVWTVKGRLGSSQIGQTLPLEGAECPGTCLPETTSRLLNRLGGRVVRKTGTQREPPLAARNERHALFEAAIAVLALAFAGCSSSSTSSPSRTAMLFMGQQASTWGAVLKIAASDW